MGSVILWYLIVLVLGWVAFPIAFVVLKHLPDKGYVFSKIIGLLLMGYLYWLLGYLAFNPATLFLSFLILAALSTVLLVSWIGKPFLEFVKKNVGFFLLMECLFLVAFLVAGAYKMRTFEIAGTEKPMDLAMIHGILASPSMPPQDPWLSNGSISYYYFGYFIVAMLCKLTSAFSVTVGEGYNLGVALTWALAALGAFSLAYALTRRYRYSLFSMACMVLFGNLDYWHRAIQSFQIGDLRIPYYNFPVDPTAAQKAEDAFKLFSPKILFSLQVWEAFKDFFNYEIGKLGNSVDFLLSPLQHNWDYFQASRIVPVPPTDKLINEFPSFSFFLSDLHPHVMAIPFVLLAVAVAYNLLKAPLPSLGVFGGQKLWQYAQWIFIALVFGALSFFNSWDFPTLMLLLGICLFLQQWWNNERKFEVWMRAVVLLGVPIVIGTFALYAPFFLKFQSQAKGLGIVTDRTDLYYLAVIFGFFFTILIPALVAKASPGASEKKANGKTKRSDELECVVCGREGGGKKFCGHCGGELAPAVQSDVTPLPHEPTRGWFQKAGSLLYSEKDPLRGWMALGVILVILLGLNLNPIKGGTLVLALFFAFLSLAALAAKTESKEMIFTTLLVFIGFLLIGGCEVLFIKDHFSDGALYRMNSVFKFHYQVWILFSLASGPLLKWLVENQWSHWVTWKKAVWSVLFLSALLGAGLYPLMAFTARMRGSSPDMATMDGEVYYQHAFSNDYDAAQWIKQNVTPAGKKVPVILEAWGGSYQQQFGVIATLTGYPTVLGWDFHEAQWRGSWDKPAIRGGDPEDTVFRRRSDVDAIYSSADINQTRDLLRRYSVDYVYVGDVEREKYKDHPENLGKFTQLGSVAQQFGNSILYKVNP